MVIDFQTVPRMPSSRLMGDLQTGYLEVIEDGEEIVDRMTARERIDRHSDDCFHRAYAYIDLIERDPKNAVEFARAAKVWIARGLEIDAAEDEHCERVAQVGDEVQTIGRTRVTTIVAWCSSCGPKGGA